jgi:RNA polymerase sigma-70 factor (ECF subfamily)
MDTRLVVRAQRGDEVAFAAITRASSGRFKQIAFRVLRDRHLAEDATQAALVEVWRTLPKLHDPRRFEAWSYRVLVHACYREARRYRRSFGVEPGEQGSTAPDELAAVNDRDQLER